MYYFLSLQQRPAYRRWRLQSDQIQHSGKKKKKRQKQHASFGIYFFKKALQLLERCGKWSWDDAAWCCTTTFGLNPVYYHPNVKFTVNDTVKVLQEGFLTLEYHLPGGAFFKTVIPWWSQIHYIHTLPSYRVQILPDIRDKTILLNNHRDYAKTMRKMNLNSTLACYKYKGHKTVFMTKILKNLKAHWVTFIGICWRELKLKIHMELD